MAVSKRLRYEVLRRDNHTCRYCGRSAPEVKLTVDHVVPIALGGSDEPSNLVTACSECNSGKTSTNPDAPLVANVAEDALRWVQARQVAAQQMLADHSRRREDCVRFKREWDKWTVGGKPIEMPPGWENSIENFVAAGLPTEILLSCVAKAMANSKIKLYDTFRYMCGIAWRKVRELQDATQSIVNNATGQPSSVVGPNPCEQAFWYLAGLPSHFDDPTIRELYAARFDQDTEDDEDDDGNLIDYSNWSRDIKALVHALKNDIDRGTEALWAIKDMVRMLPEGVRESYVRQSREAFADAGEVDNSFDNIARYALVLLIEDLYPQPKTQDVWS